VRPRRPYFWALTAVSVAFMLQRHGLTRRTAAVALLALLVACSEEALSAHNTGASPEPDPRNQTVGAGYMRCSSARAIYFCSARWAACCLRPGLRLVVFHNVSLLNMNVDMVRRILWHGQGIKGFAENVLPHERVAADAVAVPMCRTSLRRSILDSGWVRPTCRMQASHLVAGIKTRVAEHCAVLRRQLQVAAVAPARTAGPDMAAAIPEQRQG